MGRRRSSRSTGTRRSEETPDFSSPKLLRKLINPPPIKSTPIVETIIRHTAPTAFRDIEDRRTFHPQGPKRPARSIDKPTHKLVLPVQAKPARSGKTPPRLPHTVQFAAPKKVLICVRRQARKEVLHALNKTGKGARARSRRQSEYSRVKC